MIDENSKYFEIKGNGNLIKIEVFGKQYPNTDDDWDENWLNCMISVKAGPFSGKFKANLMTTDFEMFKNGITELYNKLDGVATFYTLESQVDIKIMGDGIGHLTAQCEVMDNVGVGNKLEFEIDFDQTQIPELINQLEKITKEFPVKEL